MPASGRTRRVRRLAGRALSALLGPVPLTRDQALGASERISALTSLVSSAEYLFDQHRHGPSRLNEWAISRDGYAGYGRPLRAVLDLASDRRTATALHAARVAVGSALLLPGRGRWRGAGALFLGVSGTLLYPSLRYGTDGSDQAAIVVQTATGLARISSSPAVKDALMWYVAGQCALSYLFSGWVKLLGREWRTGDALSGVMRTRTYGHEGVWRLTRRFPRASRLVAHGVLALECLFPVLYARGGALVRPVLGSVLLFHVANGVVMGLGRFLPAFAAMYPMVMYTSAPRSLPATADRDDRLPAVAGLLALGTAAASAAVAAHRRATVLDHPAPGGRVTTRHGNTIAYHGTASADRTDPVVVFVHGLGAIPLHFSWYTRALNEQGRQWLVPGRAGYGASRRGATGPYTLDESVDDLVDLVSGAVPEGRRVVLAGHSLGGEIARRAAAVLGERVHGVVYLDSSHPDQLHRSNQQAENSAKVGGALRTVAVSLRLGMGVLMSTPSWVRSLPDQVRARALTETVDSRVWNAALREWEAVERDFGDFSGPLEPLDAHALVLSAQHTVERDPDHLELHRELAAAHSADRTVRCAVIPGSDHDDLLTDPYHAARAAGLLLDFLAESTGTAPAPTTTEER
ncbi:alpha/beta fold hydrolase [Nocardiopsis changdeensis]|uniref:Alpha/beta fold hydrolase n=1 Tax=Nocardiopsis changdeensis TaxID=2831969 RepID=A0ABX8BMZ2_9ACTN|nr:MULTISPECIES: alpha/beta fold hydrolase [Nocardiopsis]QUX23397.1 alpha/beta fold hydrolase [Nocardiopsis changdeensis]QYX39339.1 alpha/beta fold hydrolase [Nocardiopsis sp. MT53]